MDWSLLSCGRSGHVTYAPQEPELREQLMTRTATGEAWRCLRCGGFITGDPQATGPVAMAPSVRRGVEVRSALILRVFAIERWLRALIFGAVSYGVWRFRGSQLSIERAFDRELPIVRSLLHQLGYNIDHSRLVGFIQHALTLSPTSILLLAVGLAGYAVIELIEGVGLWLGQRWGEYFAAVVTSLGLPYEVYDMTAKVTATRFVLFAINLALVLYLVITKRLFGVRGGRNAYEARRRSQSILEEAVNEAAAGGGVRAGEPATDGGNRRVGDTGPESTANPGGGAAAHGIGIPIAEAGRRPE